MIAKMNLTKRDKRKLLSLLLVAILAMAAVAGTVYAKYAGEQKLSGKITVSAKLATDLEIFEHQATRQTNGTYTLGTTEVAENSYVLMPGVDVPKDPTVRVTGYTGMDAYLYIEVVGEEKTDPVYFEVDTQKWTALTGETGPNGGKLYYKALGASDKADEILVEILKKLTDADNKQVRVSDTLPRTADLDVSFYAYIGQKLTADAAADFTTQFVSQTPASGGGN